MIDPQTRNRRTTGPPSASPTQAENDHLQTVRSTAILGSDTILTPDATEDYHEASRIYPDVADPFVVGATRLERSPELRLSVTRSVKRMTHRPFVALPTPTFGSVTFDQILRVRRSRREYGEGCLRLDELAAVLYAAYGSTGEVPGSSQAFRTVPSGGALFPLELYAVCPRVDGLETALYHYDPLRHGLELIRPLCESDDVAELTPYPELLANCAALLVLTAMFWRSRFKYGPRAYRFTLMEAGHVVQNALLATEALELAATPVGGFFDTRVDTFVGVDGLYEASVYLLPVGRRV